MLRLLYKITDRFFNWRKWHWSDYTRDYEPKIETVKLWFRCWRLA